jgi:hypothetical protein
MKTFRLMDDFMVPGSYMRDDGRVQVPKFDWSEDVQVTNSAACAHLNGSTSQGVGCCSCRVGSGTDFAAKPATDLHAICGVPASGRM